MNINMNRSQFQRYSSFKIAENETPLPTQDDQDKKSDFSSENREL